MALDMAVENMVTGLYPERLTSWNQEEIATMVISELSIWALLYIGVPPITTDSK